MSFIGQLRETEKKKKKKGQKARCTLIRPMDDDLRLEYTCGMWEDLCMRTDLMLNREAHVFSFRYLRLFSVSSHLTIQGLFFSRNPYSSMLIFCLFSPSITRPAISQKR